MSLKDLVKSAGSGARGAKFPDVGDIVGGVVLSSEVVPSRDDDGDVETWDDGKPKQKVRIIVQTDEDDGPDEQGREDDGKRAIYVKWWGEQRKALIDALNRVEAEDVEAGGKFWAKYSEQGPKIKKSWSPTKVMRYKYAHPPVVPDGFDDEDEPAAKPAAKPAKAAAKPAAKPAAKAAKRAAKPVEDDDLDDTADPIDSKAALKDAGLDDGF